MTYDCNETLLQKRIFPQKTHLQKCFNCIGPHHNKKNDPSLDESLSVTFIVQYVNRNLQVDLNTQILVHTNVLKSTLGSLLF